MASTINSRSGLTSAPLLPSLLVLLLSTTAVAAPNLIIDTLANQDACGADSYGSVETKCYTPATHIVVSELGDWYKAKPDLTRLKEAWWLNSDLQCNYRRNSGLYQHEDTYGTNGMCVMKQAIDLEQKLNSTFLDSIPDMAVVMYKGDTGRRWCYARWQIGVDIYDAGGEKESFLSDWKQMPSSTCSGGTFTFHLSPSDITITQPRRLRVTFRSQLKAKKHIATMVRGVVVLVGRQCPVGQAISSVDGSCVDCGPGYEATGEGCSPCRPGSFSDGVRNADCKLCDYGKYSNSTGFASCWDCPPGQATDDIGSVECRSCEPGEYVSGLGNRRCMSCSPGTYSQGGAAECTPCPSGTYQTNASSSYCATCPESGYSAQRSVDPSACGCSDGYYGNIHQGIECKPCPDRATCINNAEYPNADQGYFVSTTHPEVIATCSPRDVCPGGTQQCDGSTEGSACQRCKDGYTRALRGCARCLWDEPWGWGAVVVVVGALGLLTVLLCCGILGICLCILPRSAATTAVLYIISSSNPIIRMSGAQLTSLTTIVAVLRLDISIPTAIAVSAAPFTVLQLDLRLVTQMDCILGNAIASYYVTNILQAVVIPMGIILAIAGTGFVFRMFSRHGDTTAPGQGVWHRAVGAAGEGISLGLCAYDSLYLAVLLGSVTPFQCTRSADGVYLLMAEPSITCGSADHIAALILAFPVLAIHAIGYPLLMTVLLVATRRPSGLGSTKSSSTPQALLRTVVSPITRFYEARSHYWPIVVVLFRGSLVFLISQTAWMNGASQLGLLILIVVCHSTATAFVGPYSDRDDDWYDTLAGGGLVMLLTVLLMSGSKSRADSAGYQISMAAIFWIIVALNTGLFLFFGTHRLLEVYVKEVLPQYRKAAKDSTVNSGRRDSKIPLQQGQDVSQISD